MTESIQKVAVIGTGISGLSCASALVTSGYDVRLFDKGRTVGGRLSTRRSEHGLFNHGAQFFTARDPKFATEVSRWTDLGVTEVMDDPPANIGVAADDLPVTIRYTGNPAINDIAVELSKGLDVQSETTISAINRIDDRWRLVTTDKKEIGDFDHLAVAVPAPQAASLCKDIAPLKLLADSASYAPCWAAFFNTETPLDLAWKTAFIDHPVLSWAAFQPSCKSGSGMMLHASEPWSAENLELDRSVAAERLIDAFRELTGRNFQTSYQRGHRWRFARVTKAVGQDCSYLAKQKIGVCGDWLLAPRVEAAWLSGQALASEIRRANR